MKKMPPKSKLPQSEIDAAFNLASEVLAGVDGDLSESPYDYQCFTFKSDRVCLVFYPHKTSAWHYHIRVRNQGSKDAKEANRLMRLLDEGAGYNCVFTRKAK